MGKIAVFFIKSDGLKGIEGETAQRVSRQLLTEGAGKTLDLFEMERDNAFKIGDIKQYRDYDVFIFIYGILFITYESVNALSRIVLNRKEFSVIAPVSNESKVVHQRHTTPFFYQTLSVFKWATEEIYRKCKDEVIETDEVDDFCIAIRRELLDSLPGEQNLIDLLYILKNAGLKFGIAQGVYAHRYGDIYESGRDDLLVYVPLDAHNVLDIGCAKGLFGEKLKKRQRCSVTGVDTDSKMIKRARERLDNVIHGDIEKIIDKGILNTYDCIVCGDILEHLNNPWRVVRGLRGHLRKGGLFIASTPNITNWAVVFEMLKGRWDYVPFSILSGTHIRFFTKQNIIGLFEETGYTVKEVLLQSFDIPPKGAEFIATLREHIPKINEEEIKASEIVVVAQG